MISVKRFDSPIILKTGENPIQAGEWETLDAIEYYNDALNHPRKYKRMGIAGVRIEAGYIVYGHIMVRKVLLKMFRGKCAYCESKITTIYNGDIEHFRPKGGYCNVSTIPTTKPGYYWLAAEWENLLLACPFCNQTNTHEIKVSGEIKEVILGKLNQFPLLTEQYRLNPNHGAMYFSNATEYLNAFMQEESERLLINPCIDSNVQRFFKYDDEGAIMVNDSLGVFEKQKAAISIQVYALHRFNLALSRKEKVISIKAQIKRVENAIYHYNKYHDSSDEEKTWFEGIMREEMKILKKFKEPDQEYSGLARYIIDKYFHNANFVR